MFNRRKGPFSRRRQEGEAQAELMESLRQTKSALSRAYDGFNSTADQDLIQSYVYEINALQHRYSYLLRQVRELEPTGAAQ